MIALAGYAEKLSVRPGETIRFHVSSARPEPVETKLVRVISADANPAGPGIKEENVAANVALVSKPERQVVPLGSFATFPRSEAIGALTSFTAVVTVWVGGAAGTPGCIMAFGDLGKSSQRVLLSTMATASGICIAAMVGQGAAMPAEIASGDVEAERWYTVVLTHDAGAQSLKLSCVAHAGDVAATEAVVRLNNPVSLGGIGDLRFAGGLPGGVAGTPTGCFNGRLERPILFAQALRPEDFNARGNSDTSSLLAAWDFSREISSTRIVDIGPNGLHGTLVNQPTRAVTGSKWDGSEMSWKHAPQHYGAIHFHADDIDDCKWPVTHEWAVPEGLRSGV
ncbi:MAG: N,N-dimethylformamidase beta subunit family domain-containing protein, partial [Hyphomicrobiaceae bacterium]